MPQIEGIIWTPDAREAWLALTTDYGLADQLAGLGVVPCRDRSLEQRPALEIIPAPSPPPPDSWVVPPSPPVLPYDIAVTSTFLASPGIFFIGCMFCCSIMYKSERGRMSPRWPGYHEMAVNRADYQEKYGSFDKQPMGIVRQDVYAPATDHVTNPVTWSAQPRSASSSNVRGKAIVSDSRAGPSSAPSGSKQQFSLRF